MLAFANKSTPNQAFAIIEVYVNNLYASCISVSTKGCNMLASANLIYSTSVPICSLYCDNVLTERDIKLYILLMPHKASPHFVTFVINN